MITNIYLGEAAEEGTNQLVAEAKVLGKMISVILRVLLRKPGSKEVAVVGEVGSHIKLVIETSRMKEAMVSLQSSR